MDRLRLRAKQNIFLTMQTFIKLVFFVLFFATTAHARTPFPEIKNSTEFQNFLEQGILCENEWAAANIFKGYGRKYQKNRVNKIKALAKIAQRHHFDTKFFFRNNCNYELIIYPNKQNNKILSTDVSAIYIGSTEGDTYFLASLNTEKDLMKRELLKLGYENFESGWFLSGGELFHPHNTSGSTNILLKECNPGIQTAMTKTAKIETGCQRPSVFLGCYSQDKIDFAYRTCPW